MPKDAGEPLRKVNINLFDADATEMEKAYGYGWTEQVRLWVRDKLRERKRLREQRDGN